MNDEAFAELSAAHAMGALSPDDERIYREALAAHPEWQAIVDIDAATVASLGDGVSEIAPPPHVRDTIVSRITGMGQDDAPRHAPGGAPAAAEDPERKRTPHAAAPERPAPRRRWALWAFALAACLVVLGGAGFGAASLSGWLNRPVSVVALDEIERALDARAATAELVDGGEATAHWSESVGEAVVVAQGLPSISEDQSFELWFVRGDEPIAAGTFTAADEGRATALMEGEMRPGDLIAVTIEEEGGSQTGQPTSDPIVVIDTA
ncbi:anti-sigma factor [Microbacterium indicum]|uniref:anti-sigma factor n=1 Tax=Microbacterium indicum TaxID=358100 RepID=UPI000410749B|nr:anti-sigma factor [Microbacterium indicum]